MYYVKPTPAAMKFLAKLSDWVVHTHIHQWDQAAWNEVSMELRGPCEVKECSCADGLQLMDCSTA